MAPPRHPRSDECRRIIVATESIRADKEVLTAALRGGEKSLFRYDTIPASIWQDRDSLLKLTAKLKIADLGFWETMVRDWLHERLSYSMGRILSLPLLYDSRYISETS